MNIGRTVTVSIVAGFGLALFAEMYTLGAALVAFGFGFALGDQASQENRRKEMEQRASIK